MTSHCAQPAVTSKPVPGLDPRVILLGCDGVVDTFAVLTERFTVLVDTMINPETAEVALDIAMASARKGASLLVINTHSDWDHAWGNCLFAGASARFPAPIIGHSAAFRGDERAAAEEFLQTMREKEPGRYDAVEITPPTIRIDDSATIDGGDLTLRLIPTPGHTPDHLAVWIPEIKVLLAGDAAEMPMPFVGPRSDLGQLETSLQQMLDLKPEIALYCHGGGFSTPDLIGWNIDYFVEAHLRCRQATIAGRKVRDITPETLSWPLCDVLPPSVQLSASDTEFYTRSHERAVKAMARHHLAAYR